MARFCPYCVSHIDKGTKCTSCDYSGKYKEAAHHLIPGTVLNNKYLVGRVLGEGGFGITYIGRDLRLDTRVAIKEFYPADSVSRDNTTSTEVLSSSVDAQKRFDEGKRKFINEARALASMDKDETVIMVREFFEANNTAYIIMEYVEGQNFKNIVMERQKRMKPEELLPMLEPIFDSLERVHQAGFIHRDIAPDNIMLDKDRIRLIDFGCAEIYTDGQDDKAASVSIKPGFSPCEQYLGKGMGPWTDVYAMGATIYYCLTGKRLPNAPARQKTDTLVKPSALGVKLSPKQENAIMKALAIMPEDRFQSMREFKDALYDRKKIKTGRITVIAVIAALLLVAVSGTGIYRYGQEKNRIAEQELAEAAGPKTVSITDESISGDAKALLTAVTESMKNTSLVFDKNGLSGEFANTTDEALYELTITVNLYDADNVFCMTQKTKLAEELVPGKSTVISEPAELSGSNPVSADMCISFLRDGDIYKTGTVPVALTNELLAREVEIVPEKDISNGFYSDIRGYFKIQGIQYNVETSELVLEIKKVSGNLAHTHSFTLAVINSDNEEICTIDIEAENYTDNQVFFRNFPVYLDTGIYTLIKK